MNQTNRMKDFYLVAIGQIISLFGNQILRYALPLYLLAATGSSSLFGSINAISFLPMVLLFPIGGIIADRMNKRNIMVILDYVTAGLITAFCLLTGHLNMVVLIAVTMILLYGIQGIYQPTVKASIPALVDNDRIIKANSIVDIINSLSSMTGPVLGGILFTAFGLRFILIVSIICFFLSATMELFIHIPYQKSKADGNMIQIAKADISQALRYMTKSEPTLMKMSLFYAFINLLLSTLIMIGVPVIVTQHLGFDSDVASRLYGYSQGIISAASVVGGALAGILSKKLKPGNIPTIITVCSTIMLSIGIVILTAGNSYVIYAVLVAGCASVLALQTLFTVMILSMIQMLCPPELIGKIIACVMCIAMCTNPIGQFLYGMMFDIFSGSLYLPYFLAGSVMMVICFICRKVFVDSEIKQDL